ncbi:cryptochrome/photolyase family protein [Staphylococcus argenteus]|uniref:cryptochrome/photolyase family protein n=1 Tax=Staphylococcus argenteus TaxID=985002 RepID=UPI001BDB0A49|nr:deoxyribodipyrimidine photo-lyase [Staphylococcus argenteus]
MAVAVLLNRMFRTENNPLFEYIYQQRDTIKSCFFIIAEEDMSTASELKASFYRGTMQRFYQSLLNKGFIPHVLSYENIISFCKKNNITEVVVAGDIMSYHLEDYDILHQRPYFEEAQIEVTLVRGNHYFKASKTMNQQGEPYKVFTSFYKKWRPYLRIRDVYHYDLSELKDIVIEAPNELSFRDINEGSTESIEQDKWQRFLNHEIHNYENNREYLPEVLTSQLSIALAYGLLDIIEIFNDLLSRYEEDEANYESFIRELIFREFYYVLMTQFPETAQQSFKEKYRRIKWSDNEADFDAWCDGQTGFPIIDAAMMELQQTGFMHNRMRMVTSQFLTKDLFIDWTWGENFFRKYLIDYDAASNVHGWQWSASTGTDAVPYFRMFNPIRQSERFDPKALYIKKYLPILNQVDAKYLHDTHQNQSKILGQGVELGHHYPKQIVNHKEKRDQVLAIFKSID